MRPTRTTRTLLRHSRPAFSLLEITLVLVIIGILMGVAAVNLLGQSERASIRATEATMNTYKTNIQSFMAGNAATPPQSLQVLVDQKFVSADANGRPPQDAWNQDIFYSPEPDAQGHPFQLISKGPDKQPGTEDDINLWNIGKTTTP